MASGPEMGFHGPGRPRGGGATTDMATDRPAAPGRAAPTHGAVAWPLFALVLTWAVTLVTWRHYESIEQRAERALLEQHAQALSDTFGEAVATRIAAFERMAQRQALASDGIDREQLFTLDAQLYRRDYPSLAAIAWLDAGGHVLQEDGTAFRVGQDLAHDPMLAPLLRRARTQTAPLRAEAHGTGSFESATYLLIPGDGGVGRQGYLVATMTYGRLLPSVLAPLAPNLPLRVAQAGRVIYDRAPGLAEPVLRRPLLQGDGLELQLWPEADARLVTSLGELLLAAGLVCGVLLAGVLRQWRLARQRADQADASRQALAAESAQREQAQQARGEAERELAQIFQSISEAFYALDEQWRFTHVNPLAEQLMRLPRDALVGGSLWELFPDTRGTIVEESFRRAMQDKVPVSFEVHYPPLEGWFDVRVFPHPRGIAVYFRDINDRKAAEQELVRARATSERAQQLAQLGTWELNLRDGRLTWSDQVCRILGVGAGALARGLPALLERVHFEDRARLQEAQRALHAGEADLDIEYRVLRPDGENRVVRELGTLVRDQHGQPALAIGSIQDVTERRQGEDALREMARRLERSLVMNRLVMDHSLDAICALDANGRFLQVSAASQAVWGVPANELVGRAYMDLVHPDDRGQTLRAAAAAMAGQPVHDLRNRCVRRDGGEVVVQWSLGWSPQDRMLFAVARDVTALDRQARALVEARDSLQRAQQVAHMGAWQLDVAGQVLSWSDEVYRIFHVRPDEFADSAEAFAARAHPDDLPRFRAAQARVLAGQGELDLEHRILLPDGSVGHVHQRARLLRNDQGQPWLLAGSVQDITERKRLREQVARGEQMQRIAGRAARLGGWVVDVAGGEAVAVHWSDDVAAIHGMPAGHAPTFDEGLDFYVGADRDEVAACLRRCMRAGESFDFEGRIRTRDGRIAWVRAIGDAVRDDEGRVVRVEGAFQDISERREQEQRLRQSVESALDCIILMAADGTVLEFNPAAERTFGYRREQVLGRALADLIVPERLRAAHVHAVARWTPEGGRGTVIGRRIEMPALRADGSEIIVELNVSELEGANPPVFTAFLRDVTESRRAQALEAGQRVILGAIAGREPLPAVLDQVTRLCEAQMPDSLCSILLLDADGRRVHTGAAPSLPDAYNRAINGLEIGPERGSCGTSAYRRERVVVTDIATDPLWAEFKALAAGFGLAACWSTPVLASDGRVLATFATYYRQPRSPAAEELALIDGLAALTAVAIEQANAFRELAVNEQRFRSLFDEHPDAVYSMDLEGHFTAVNGHFSEMTGIPAATAVGRPFDGLAAPEQLDMVRAHFHAASRGEARSYEMTGVTPSGERIELRVTNLPMLVEGRITGVFGIAQDIRLLRKHQRELAEALDAAENSSRQLRRLSDSAIRLNRGLTDADMYQQLADALRDTVGAHQALVSLNAGGTFVQHIHAVSLSEKYAAWRGYDAPSNGSGIYAIVGEQNRTQRMTQAELEAHPRWRGFGKEAGRHPPMRGWLAVPLFGSDGANIGQLQLSDKFVGDFTEDDELVAVQFAQMASIAIERARLINKLNVRDRFFELSAEVFVIFDPATHRFTEVNPMLCEITGYGRDELTSRPFTDFLHPDDRGRAGDRAESLRDGTSVVRDFQVRYLRKGGGVRWIDWLSSSAPDGQVYAVGRDVTERRKAEEALRLTLTDLDARNRELQDFAFIASHDLQEPLRKIRAFSDRIQQRHASQLGDEARDYLERTSQAATRMQTLIDDLLAYSRVSARGRPFVPVDLGKLLAAVRDDLEARIESSGGCVEAGPLPTVDGDPTQLRQLLQNLVANALKFRSPERAPVVRVTAAAATQDHVAGWELRVEDNGIGFEPRYADKVFAPFQRLHGRHEYEGTGIGLAIVRRIVERHRGAVRAEGRPGQGACFVVWLPARQPAAGDGPGPGVLQDRPGLT